MSIFIELFTNAGVFFGGTATTLNIPDTTGWNMPWEFGGLIGER